MEQKQYVINYTIYNHINDLEEADSALLKKALKARENAYAPYSEFKVGAAVLLENGTVVIGSNQENAAYPSGLCAERVAIYAVGAQYPNQKIKRIAICASSIYKVLKEPAAPCGSCRQSLLEYEFKQKVPIQIVLYGIKGKVLKFNSVSDLLPLVFRPEFL